MPVERAGVAAFAVVSVQAAPVWLAEQITRRLFEAKRTFVEDA